MIYAWTTPSLKSTCCILVPPKQWREISGLFAFYGTINLLFWQKKSDSKFRCSGLWVTAGMFWLHTAIWGLLAARAILFSVTFSSGLRSGDLHVGLPALYSFAYLELELEATKMESLYSPPLFFRWCERGNVCVWKRKYDIHAWV